MNFRRLLHTSLGKIIISICPKTFIVHGPGAPYFGKQLVICIVLGSQSMSPIGLLLYGKMNKNILQTRKSRQVNPHTQTGVKTEGIPDFGFPPRRRPIFHP